MRTFARILLLASFAAAVGCGATEDQLRARAAFDMQCPAEQIHLTEIDARTQGVDACGKRGVYVESCDGPKNNMGTKCTWVLNGRSGE